MYIELTMAIIRLTTVMLESTAEVIELRIAVRFGASHVDGRRLLSQLVERLCSWRISL